MEYKASSMGLSPSDFSVPKTIVIGMKSILRKLAEMISASSVTWPYSKLGIGIVDDEKIGLIPLTIGAPHTAFLVEVLVE